MKEVFRITHDLIRSDLMKLIQGARTQKVTPEELDAWLLHMYIRLELKLEDEHENIR